MSIEDESAYLTKFLSESTGFGLNYSDQLSISPVGETAPYTWWIVGWENQLDGFGCYSTKSFNNLEEAAQFFVEKRRYLCLGGDFRQLQEVSGID